MDGALRHSQYFIVIRSQILAYSKLQGTGLAHKSRQRTPLTEGAVATGIIESTSGNG